MTSIGLVLGAGGVTGHAYHAGTLAALSELTGWDPRTAEIVVGTSAGSGVGAALRGGLSASDLRARATGRPLSDEGQRLTAGMARPASFPQPRRPARPFAPQAPGLLARDLLQPWKLRPGRALAAVLPEGAVDTEPLGERMRRLHGTRWPRQPLWICAMRLRDGALVALGREGPVTDVGTAVQASSAIPGFFAPVVIDGERYVDGGAHSPTNADVLAGLHLDLVIVLSPMSAPRPVLVRHPRAAPRVLHHATLAREVQRLQAQGTEVLVFEPGRADIDAMGFNALDARRLVPVTDQAYRSAAARLERDDRVRSSLEALATAP